MRMKASKIFERFIKGKKESKYKNSIKAMLDGDFNTVKEVALRKLKEVGK